MDTLSPHASNGNSPEKRCTQCNRNLPATREHFYADKRAKDGLQSACNQCGVKKSKAYAADHKEKIRLYKAQYRADHQDHHKLYLQEHCEEISEQRKDYYKEHQDHLRQYTAQYRQTERGRMSMKAANHNRKARKKNGGGSHTAQELQEQFKRQHGHCYYCKVKLHKVWHADHVIPLSRGGSNDISNIVVACPTCNQSKYNKLPHEWIEGGRLL